MTASATHEVRNVLAIIKESAGLVDDLVQVQGSHGRLDPEKIRGALDRINAQVRRGADLLTHLNRLAHTLDEDISRVEMNQEVFDFYQDLIRLRKSNPVLSYGDIDYILADDENQVLAYSRYDEDNEIIAVFNASAETRKRSIKAVNVFGCAILTISQARSTLQASS